jgi:hypothetical protein
MESGGGFWRFVLLRAAAIPAVWLFGLHAVGHVVATLRKILGGRFIVDLVFCGGIIAMFLYEFIPAVKSVWLDGGVFSNIFTSVLLFVVLFDVLLVMFIPYFSSMTKSGGSDIYWATTLIPLVFLFLYLSVEFLLSYWGLSLIPTLMQLLLLLGLIVSPFVFIGGMFQDEESATNSSSRSPKKTMSYHPSYGGTYEAPSCHTEDSSPKRNIFTHTKTDVSFSVTKTYDNGDYDLDYDATFYFRNDEGDEETKTACGRFSGISSANSVNVSDVEYRHSHLLRDYEK